jgi:hypothetical protein
MRTTATCAQQPSLVTAGDGNEGWGLVAGGNDSIRYGNGNTRTPWRLVTPGDGNGGIHFNLSRPWLPLRGGSSSSSRGVLYGRLSPCVLYVVLSGTLQARQWHVNGKDTSSVRACAALYLVRASAALYLVLPGRGRAGAPEAPAIGWTAFNMSTAVPATAYMYSGYAAVHACVRLVCVGRVGGGVSQCAACLYHLILHHQSSVQASNKPDTARYTAAAAAV